MRNLILVLTICLSGSMAFAQAGDQLLGTWLNEKNDSKIKIYRKGNKYYGKILWLKNDKNDDGSSPKVDSKNPNKKLRSRRIVGTIILKNLVYDKADKEWNSGEIYDPRGGSTYSVFAKLKNDNTLYLKGFIGFAIIGRSTLWTRVK